MAELVVKEAEKWFRREDGQPFKVIDRLSFAAREGCVTVLIGPSGCGKSTLLNSIVGLERLDHGELLFIDHGQPRLRPLIGYVFQSPRLLPWKTIGENISLALKGAGLAREQREARVRALFGTRRAGRVHEPIPALPVWGPAATGRVGPRFGDRVRFSADG